MRLGWLALPSLFVLVSCSPVRTYREAARSLHVTLTRVEPSLHLALPMEKSSLTVRVTLHVENPSSVAFHLKGFEGGVHLEAEGGPLALGQVKLLRSQEILPGSQADLPVEVTFLYQDLQAHWKPLAATLLPGASGAWRLEGTLQTECYRIPLQVPVKTRHTFGGAP